jgi:phage terminase large subunit-like protein
MNMQALTRQQKIEFIKLVKEKKKRELSNKCLYTYQSFYPWQRDFCAATSTYYESCLCAANQIGKTYTGTAIDAYHLLGDYPDDWPGHKFDFAPLCWGLGYSMEKTRDLLQAALFGDYQGGEFTGGLVPKDRILSWESAQGTPNAMRTVWVKHRLGKSCIQFWSYSQGQHAIMGDVVDWVHIDEEPKDQTIRPQVLTRTINGDKGKGGRIIYTFTPENGRTELVIKFMDNPSSSQFFMKKGWDDAPHITEEKKLRMLEAYPENQKKMRTQGEPLLGTGRIYDLSDEFILCEPFNPPAHWNEINAMDFGWDHPQAHVKIYINPDTDAIYVAKSWKQSKVSANDAFAAVRPWSAGVPTAWPSDGLQHEKGRDDATQQKEHYVTAGFNMLPEHACWPDVPDGQGNMMKGGNSVEQGLYEIRDKMSKGLFKVFNGNHELMDEIGNYHRNEKGKIVKVKDDLLDAVRYAYMMRRYAVKIGDKNVNKNSFRPSPIRTMGRR